MKSNYNKLGDYIQEVNVRNTELNINNLLGINIDKFFMPSVANIVGTDMANYKIVKNGQFACNRMHVGRDKRLPVALLKREDGVIVSPAYNVFEIIDEEVLDKEFLMMWFSRNEFDRNAWFYTDADVRGGLSWEDFCNMQIPVPPINKQKGIVKEYKVLVDRIDLNNRLIQKLEETALAIYKQWFIDFEFPDETGNPYKTNGGEMEFNKELDKEIPKGWKVKSVFEVSTVQYGYPFESELFCSNESLNPIIRIRDILSNETETFSSEKVDEKYLIKDGDILIGMDGTFHVTLWFGGTAWQNQRIVRLRCDKDNSISSLQIKYSINQPLKELEGSIEGTTVAHLSDKDIKGLMITVADNCVQERISSILNISAKNMIRISKENTLLKKMLNILLSKLAALEDNL